MITTIVQFKLASSITPEKAKAMFTETSGNFVNMNGLIRKYFLLPEDGLSAASVYLWESRQPAESFFSEMWMDFMIKRYGFRPVVTYYECPIVVDNKVGEIVTSE